MTNYRTHIIALAAVASIAGAAPAAAQQQDLRSPDASPAPVSASVDLRSPDAQSQAGAYVPVAARADLRSPDASEPVPGAGIDRRAPDSSQPVVRGPAEVAPPQPIVAFRDRFDWSDAGIGAGALMAIVLLVTGGVVFRRRHQHPAIG